MEEPKKFFVVSDKTGQPAVRQEVTDNVEEQKPENDEVAEKARTRKNA